MTSRRNTIQKDLVRNAVYEMRRHVTANEVYEFIKEAYPIIGKGTVYRNLDILVEEGALRKVEMCIRDRSMTTRTKRQTIAVMVIVLKQSPLQWERSIWIYHEIEREILNRRL